MTIASDTFQSVTAAETGRRFQIVAVALTAFGIVILVATAMVRTGGLLVYSLDDPYIHLSVAENILAGGYGVNSDEFASPSSSILYPLMLAGLLALGLGTLVPLALSAAAMMAAVWLLSGLVWRHGVRPGRSGSQAFAYAMLPLGILAINGFALPLTGMEHTLHVLAVAMVLVGLDRLETTSPVPVILVAGLLLGPYIRFEGLALTAAGVAALVWYRRYLAASLVTLVVVVGFGVYVSAMISMGLPPLPSSVMEKSDVSASLADQGIPSVIEPMMGQLSEALGHPRGRLLFTACIALLLAIAIRTGHDRKRLAVAAVALTALTGHLAAGQYDWFSRYEIYAVALACGALVMVWGPLLMASAKSWMLRPGVVAALVVTAAPYLFTTLQTPAASENVYLQQYQMHRFATEFLPVPVAVNDLGYVSYDNSGHVLDLWGLGSEEARLRRERPGFGPDDLRELVRPQATVYAMIYDLWLAEALPPEWCRIAELQTPRVSVASGVVAFYLIRPEREADMRSALRDFATKLPAGASLSIASCLPA